MNMDKTMETFRARGFHVAHFETGAQAADYVMTLCGNDSVGIGGSETVAQLQLYPRLQSRGEVYWHKFTPDDPSTFEKAAGAQVYLCSANAVSCTGELVNIDGRGNRLAASVFGHEKMVFIVGANKLADDLQSAVFRARNVASPLNARRLGKRTPCASGDELKCYDCSSPERICRALNILAWPMTGTRETHIVFVDETLGY